MLKKILLFMALLLTSLGGVIWYNTARFTSKQILVPPVQPVAVPDAVVERLAEAIRIKTISYDGQPTDTAAFGRFNRFLSKSFPLCDSLLTKRAILGYSLLYEWKGSDPDLKPGLLMGHTDVVPVEDEGEWEQPPFSGNIADGFLWGRGSLDDKLAVLGTLEAAEMLLAEGFKPKRTLYLAFGHDEEVLGTGAMATVEWLQKNGIELEFVLDEGMVVTRGLMPGVLADVALIGLSEKGYLSVELTAKAEGGHSSMPPPETAVGILCNAVAKLEANPMPQRIEGPVKLLFDYAGREMTMPLKAVFANQWLFGGLLKSQLSGSASTNATTRTTTAPTMLKGSIKENVLASEAKAVINFRILPGDTRTMVLEHVKKVIGDNRVAVGTTGEGSEPSPVADVGSHGYKVVEKAIREVFPTAVVAPGLTVATTDSRHYTTVCKNVLRFLPVTLTGSDLDRIHGSNERIAPEDYKKLIRFYRQVMLGGF